MENIPVTALQLEVQKSDRKLHAPEVPLDRERRPTVAAETIVPLALDSAGTASWIA